MKSDIDLVRDIYDKHGEEFVEIESRNPTRRFISNFIGREMGRLKGKRVLDAGCGAGVETVKIARRAGSVVGIDVSPKMIEMANRNCKAENLYFLLGNMERTPFKDNSFDVVTSIFSIMYVRNLKRTFAEYARVLKPGGELLIAVPHPTRRLLKNVHDYYKVGKVWVTHGRMRYFNYHRKIEDYVNSLSAAGFVIEKISEPKLKIKKFREDYYPWHLVIKAKKRKNK